MAKCKALTGSAVKGLMIDDIRTCCTKYPLIHSPITSFPHRSVYK